MKKLEKPDATVERRKEDNRRLTSELRWVNGEVRRLTQTNKHHMSQFRDLE